MKKVCTDEIGKQILREFCRGESVEDLRRRLGISRESFYRWRRHFRERERASEQLCTNALRRQVKTVK